ncbi:RND transporter [Solemya velesiana gill symbiont]|uniref:RND transporter n=1 Tax=Solemya velesiana gill symbiont TaxID=1918948 RepID=A0A1T2KXE1_9GAMM|nr:RND transporter [Solemya velesiana gill symbiont]OOZ37430.1 RND transporter [Solemya velesiana gill symbiont]
MKWLDELPMPFVVIAAVFLGLAPFVPEPHVVEKLRMLAEGTLVKPIDIFDLFLHSAPVVVLILKLMRLKEQG